ncbi:hypothetical protein [Lentzea cavernae]|uniref:Uncharacterized protein n=1 Tax=Lentzea cavernae TaxID=2020703 RepID=A0ABQ3MJ42_9PSEU|nr:hypothetical protein [Lentzea cavernae]GHH48914.1 hypothetical protein GCM10017774_55460 [Lentzea cavernae]
MDDLDDELRRLFNDDRLDVHSEPVAVEAVVSGARRRRRRRTAVTGAVAVVALVGAGIGLTHLTTSRLEDTTGALLTTGTSATSTPTSPPPVSTVVSTVTQTVNAPPGTGTPDDTSTGDPGKPSSNRPSTTLVPESQPGRYGTLALGMPEAEALETGSLVEPSTPADAEQRCKAYATKSVPDANAVIVSPAKGIVRIMMPSYAKTPKNVGAGSTVADVKTAYANAAQSGSHVTVQMAASPPWTYVFEIDGTTVTTVFLRLAAGDCTTA